VTPYSAVLNQGRGHEGVGKRERSVGDAFSPKQCTLSYLKSQVIHLHHLAPQTVSDDILFAGLSANSPFYNVTTAIHSVFEVYIIMKHAVREIVEEPDQRCQQINEARILRNEKIRLVIICWSLLAIALAFVLFLFTHNVFPLFLTIVLTFLGYKHLDTSLGRS
jgi:uncharacterized protein YacL